MTAHPRNPITGQPYTAAPNTTRVIADPSEGFAIGAHDKRIIERALYQYYTTLELMAVSLDAESRDPAFVRVTKSDAARAFELFDLIGKADDVCIKPEE